MLPLSIVLDLLFYKKFPAFYGIRMFITTFACASHLSLSWSSPFPHPISWRSNLILSSHLHLVLPSCLFPPSFVIKTLYAPLLSPIPATCQPTPFFDLITQTILVEEYRWWCSLLCSFLHYLVTSSLLGPNIFPSIPFSDIISLWSSLNVSDQVLHPYKTTGKL